MHTLTCPCGAIEVTVRGVPVAQFYCHCDDCRKMTSGAYAAESVHAAAAVWTLQRNPRHYCGTCGGRLFIEIPRLTLRGVNAFLLPQDAFTPQFHVNCRFAVRPVNDELPHFARMPPQFGGSDEKVDW